MKKQVKVLSLVAVVIAPLLLASGCAEMAESFAEGFIDGLETTNRVAFDHPSTLSCAQLRDVRDYLSSRPLNEQGQARLDAVQWEILSRCP